MKEEWFCNLEMFSVSNPNRETILMKEKLYSALTALIMFSAGENPSDRVLHHFAVLL